MPGLQSCFQLLARVQSREGEHDQFEFGEDLRQAAVAEGGKVKVALALQEAAGQFGVLHDELDALCVCPLDEPLDVGVQAAFTQDLQRLRVFVFDQVLAEVEAVLEN